MQLRRPPLGTGGGIRLALQQSVANEVIIRMEIHFLM